MKSYESWGRYPKAKASIVKPFLWQDDQIDFCQEERSYLAYGQGRSYGDCCLNDQGVLIDMSRLSKFIEFDAITGIIRCEAGITLGEILDISTLHGWFLPVTPGTKHVSLGGAIANDVHGKNHHVAGTFGRHVLRFELLRSTGERYVCSRNENVDLFRATIGGLGLTGVILWAELQLKLIKSHNILAEHVRFTCLRDFFALSQESDGAFEYTVAWIDCLNSPKAMGRGIFFRGNHDSAPTNLMQVQRHRPVNVPVNAPNCLLNWVTARMFNACYYRSQAAGLRRKVVHFDRFFYPLDGVDNWNRLYGSRGFLQYQCVVGGLHEYDAMEEILRRISASGLGSFLGVLKRFGSSVSPGLLSFPRPGVTLALDFPNQGADMLRLMESLDEVVRENGGAVYPAKDARMSAKNFRTFFPQLEQFCHFVDPKFSSNFWRRVSSDS